LPRGVLRTLLALLAVGCGTKLPDTDAPGAVVMRERCTGCHGVYAPASMTLEMWKVQLARMRAEFARRGIPWLNPEEERALLAYLGLYAGTS